MTATLFEAEVCRGCKGTARCSICEGGSAGLLYVCAACRGSNRCFMDCAAGVVVDLDVVVTGSSPSGSAS